MRPMRSLLARDAACSFPVLVGGATAGHHRARRRPAAAGIRPRARCSACSREIEPGVSVQVDNVPGAAGTIGLARFIQSERGNPGRAAGHRPGDGERRDHQRLAGLARRRHADRAAHRRIRSHRRAGGEPVSIAGRSGRRVQEGSRQRLLGRRIGRRHRRSAGAAARRADRPCRRRASTTSPSPAAARRWPRCSADRSSAAVSGYAEFAGQIAAGQLRVLAVSAPSRVAGIDAPTLRESRHRARPRQLARRSSRRPVCPTRKQAALDARMTSDGREPAVAGDRSSRTAGTISSLPARRSASSCWPNSRASTRAAASATRPTPSPASTLSVTLTPITLPSMRGADLRRRARR